MMNFTNIRLNDFMYEDKRNNKTIKTKMIVKTSQKKFPCKSFINLNNEELELIFDFAYKMASEYKHREHRSGGIKNRKPGEIFADTFQGKIAEYAVCKLFSNVDPRVKPDFNVYDRNIWDTVDLLVNGKSVSIKSTSSYGQLLLLECADWAEDGSYIPNNTDSVCQYDYTVLCRVRPHCNEILKYNRMLYSYNLEKDRLKEIILCKNQEWLCDIPGYITLDDLIDVIKKGNIVYQDYCLNKTTPLDADNYYIQAGDLRDFEDLLFELKNK